MRFQYYLPERNEPEQTPDKFLPSIAFVIFSLEGKDSDSEMQGIYSRRIPHVMKIKMDLISKFRTNYILPLDKSKGEAAYLETKPDAPWTNPSFIERFERFDYLVGGSLSLEKKYLYINLYSHIDGKIIHEKTFQGEKERFPEFIGEYLLDMLNFFEIIPAPDEKELMKSRPTLIPEAFETFLKALDLDPANPLGGDHEDTYRELLIKTLQSDPENSEAAGFLTSHATKLNRSGKSEAALETIRNLLKVRPRDRTAALLMVKILLNNRKTHEAIRLLEEKSSAYPDMSNLPFIVARENMFTDRREITEKLYRKAMELDPDNPDLYDNFGYFLATIKKTGEALDILKTGIDRFPYREYTLLNYAQANSELSRFEEADRVFHMVQELFPDSPRVLASRAQYRLMRKELPKAIKLISRALDMVPEDPAINLTAAGIYEQAEDMETACRLAKTAIDLNPDSILSEEARYYFSRVSAGITEAVQEKNRDEFLEAVIIMRKSEFQKAVEIFQRVVEVEPQYWRAWFLKGISHRMMGDFTQALASFEQVDELFEDQVSLHHEIGKCLMGREEYEKAYYHIRQAFKNRPEDPEIMSNMALVYLRLGRLQEAEILFTQAKKMDPYSKRLDIYIRYIEKIKKRKKSSRGNGDTKD